jgi:hypothetical protein
VRTYELGAFVSRDDSRQSSSVTQLEHSFPFYLDFFIRDHIGKNDRSVPDVTRVFVGEAHRREREGKDERKRCREWGKVDEGMARETLTGDRGEVVRREHFG